MVAEFLIERQRCRIETGQHAFDQGGLERFGLPPVSATQEGRSFERKWQMGLKIGYQKQRRRLVHAQLSFGSLLFEALHQ